MKKAHQTELRALSVQKIHCSKTEESGEKNDGP